MATEREIAPGIVEERRSKEAYLTMLLGQDYRLTLYREVVIKVNGEVKSNSRDDKPIVRTASQIAEKTVTVGENTYTGAEVMAVLAAFFDLFDEEDQSKLNASVVTIPPEQGEGE